MAGDEPPIDNALLLMMAALARLDLDGRAVPAAALRHAIDIIEAERWKAAGGK